MIDEETQNEIHSFHSDNTSENASENTIVRNALLSYKKSETELKRNYRLHIIWAGRSQKKTHNVEMEIQRLNLYRPMLTILYRVRQYCVTNKDRIDLQDNGGWRSGQNFVLPNNQSPIGDDLYDFLHSWNDRNMCYIGWAEPEFRYCFHFPLIPNIKYFSIVRGGFLSNDELVKDEASDQKFMNSFLNLSPDAVKEKSKSGAKYALSLCFRKTEVIWRNKNMPTRNRPFSLSQ